MSEELEREAVAEEVWAWLQTPYHHHGRVKGAGVDCLGLLCEVFERVGLVDSIRPGPYAHDWHLHRNAELYAEGLMKFCRIVTDRDPRKGDIVLFRFGRTFSHAGIVVSTGATPRQALLIHSYLGRGVIATRLCEEPLDGREFQLWSYW